MALRTPPGPRVLVFSSRRPSLKRTHLGLYLGLTALVVAVLAVHGLRAAPDEAVPALAPPPAADSGPAPLSRYLGSRARSYLQAVLPLLSLQAEDRPRSWSPDLGGLVQAAIRLVSGVDFADPRTLLRQQVPLLVHADIADTPFRAADPPWPRADSPTWFRLSPPAVPAAGGEGPLPVKVAVYHTHAQEAYLPAMFANPAGRSPRESFSLNPGVGVLRVGEELVRELEEVYRVGAVQDRAIYDREGRLSSYERSAMGVSKLLAAHPGLQVMVDLHRDEGHRANTTAEVDGRSAARVLIVVGTDRNLPHPDWRKNYAFARRVVAIMEETYPGLSMGIRDHSNRYNQHLFPGLLLVEVGCQENTLEEALYTARLLAAVLARLLGEGAPGS